MKKILLSFIVIITLITTTSCTISSHTHNYSDKYQYNDETHWKNCQQDKCLSTTIKENHAYSTLQSNLNGKILTLKKKCVCGHETIEQKEYNPLINSSDEWNLIFQSLNLTNYSLVMTDVYTHDVPISDIKFNKIEDTIMLSYLNQNPNYVIKSSNETYNFYEYDNIKGYYLVTEAPDEYYKRLLDMFTICISLVDCFDKFIYEESTGIYKCQETINAYLGNDEDNRLQIYLYNLEIEFVDGKIFSIKSDFTDKKESIDIANKLHFNYYNIGITEIAIPNEVIENAKEYDEVLNNNK